MSVEDICRSLEQQKFILGKVVYPLVGDRKTFVRVDLKDAADVLRAADHFDVVRGLEEKLKAQEELNRVLDKIRRKTNV